MRLLWAAVLLAFSGLAFGEAKDVVPDLLSASVIIKCGEDHGSGVCFRNGERAFIWTDAHVVEDAMKMKTVINTRTGQYQVTFIYDDVVVGQDVIENGRKVGNQAYMAKVIRFSAKNDLALLLVHKKNWPEKSVVFAPANHVPDPGADIFHVGSALGVRGTNSVSKGTVSSVGRLRRDFEHNEIESPVIYDQIAITAHPGCSGGGVFGSAGECIGLVTEFVWATPKEKSYGYLLMTPTRRLRKFAKEAKCLWAVDDTMAFPANDTEPINQDLVIVEPSRKMEKVDE